MNTTLNTADITQQTFVLLWRGRKGLLPFAGALFLCFVLTGVSRWLFPGVYVFNPFDLGWLLIPEALVLGPILALMHHRIMDTGKDFAWSRDNRLVKLGKAVAYFYVFSLLFTVGIFVTTQVVPALVGFVLGPAVAGLFPVIVGVGGVLFLFFFVRLLLVYPVLAGEEREPIIISWSLTRGKARKIASCLLLLAAPVLIPWVAVSMFGGGWLDPSRGGDLRPLAIIVRSLLLTTGAIVISTGLCAVYAVLAIERDNSESDA